MKIAILTDERVPRLLNRLQGLGHRVQLLPPERLPTLDAKTLDLVCVVPWEVTVSRDWPDVRVRLARASRYYVVVGEPMGTREVMAVARDGAHDALCATDPDARWEEALQGAANSQALWWQLYGTAQPLDAQNLAGRSGAMQALRESIQRIGPTDATVLIMGESGTGKERVAEAIHAASGRTPFVTVNCAAIPSELMESELFGVEKGAFTGANRSRVGLVEEAAGGTLFLDEIGEMELNLQPKLLRFLETRRARRVGSTTEYRCALRVVSATNRDLRHESENGRFRLDLYYRLSEVVLNTPPLRHRPEDIPDLARIFLQGAAERMGKNFERVEPELIQSFQQYRWPGNVRELRQAIERMAIHYDGPVMRESFWVPPEVPGGRRSGSHAPFAVPGGALLPLMSSPTAAPTAPALSGHHRRGGPAPGVDAASLVHGSDSASRASFPSSGLDSAASSTAPGNPQSGLSAASSSFWPATGPVGPGQPGPPPPGHGPSGSGYPGGGAWGPGFGGNVAGFGRPPNKRERFQQARQLIEESGGDLTWVAAQLGIHPTTLYRWRKNGQV